MDIKQIGINIILISVTILILILVITLILNKLGVDVMKSSQITYEKCCGGSPCSDTYYNEETKECIIGHPDTNFIPWQYKGLSILILIGVAIVLSLIVHFISKDLPIPKQ